MPKTTYTIKITVTITVPNQADPEDTDFLANGLALRAIAENAQILDPDYEGEAPPDTRIHIVSDPWHGKIPGVN